MCAFLGNPGTRSRYLSKCVPDLTEHRLFENWRHKVVDWKWGYMEDLLQKFSSAAEVFFERLPCHALDGIEDAARDGAHGDRRV